MLFTGHVKHVATEEDPTTVEYVPAEQLTQVATVEAPVAVEYFPSGQLMHVVAPTFIEYLPVAH